MKSMLMCAIVTVVSAVQQEIYEVPQQRLRAVVDKFGIPCAEKYSVDAYTLVPKIADASIPRDDNAINEFLYCFCFTAGYVQEDGHIRVDKLAGLLPSDHPRMGEMKKAIIKCNEINKENKVQTVIAMNDCVADTAPVRFVFAL